VFKGVNRELGRTSRLLGSDSRNKGDRHNQHPGVYWTTPPAGEPTPAQAGRDTNRRMSNQGTGREPKADQPGRTEVVVATHSTAGQGTPARTRGEPRPKGPTITAARPREGNAGHGVYAKERQEGLRAHNLSPQNWHGVQRAGTQAIAFCG
jgi:cysteine synthase